MIAVTEMMAIGSLAADSISVIADTLRFMDLVRRMEKTAAASVEEMIVHSRSECIKDHPLNQEKHSDETSAVITTPAVARDMAGLATGLK